MTDDPKRTPNAPFHPPGVGRYPAVDDRLTTKVEAAPSWAISMQESINKQFSSVNAHLDLQDSAFDGLQVRVGVLEAAQAKRSTGPQRSYSGPIQALTAKSEDISQNDLKQDAVISQILVKSAETATKVDSLVTTQTEQTSKLTKLEATVGASDKRKMEILEDVYKRGTSFLDSPTGRIAKGLLYLAIAGLAATKGIHIGP